MTKPTLLQTLFNQPSRSYIDLYSNQDCYTLQPPKRQRRSYDGASPANSRRSSLRLSGASFATTFNFSDLPTIPPTPPSKDDAGLKKTMEDKVESKPRSGLAQPAESTPWPPRSNLAAAAHTVEHRPISTASNSSSTQDFQEAAERHSWALSSASTSRSATPRASLVEPLADTSTSSAPLHPTRRPPSMSRRLRKQRKSKTEEESIALQRELGEMGIMDKQDVRRDSLREAVAEEGEEEDLFFTPPTSPPGSPNQTLTGKQYFPSLESAALHAERQEEEQNGYSSPTKTPRALRRRRPIASPAKDGATPIRSASPSDDSSSDESFSNWRSSSSYTPSLSTAPTSVSGFSAPSPKSSSPTKSSRQPAHTSISTSTSSRGSTKSSHGKQLDSTSADWAKGVKWLGAPKDKPARPSRSWTHSRRSSVDLSTSASSASSIFDHPVVIDRSERRRSFDSATSDDRPNRWDLMGDSNKGPSHHKRPNSMGSHHGAGSSGGAVGTRRRHTRARTSAGCGWRDAETDERWTMMERLLGLQWYPQVSTLTVHQGHLHFTVVLDHLLDTLVHALRTSCSRSSGTASSYGTVELPSIPATTDGQVTYPNGFTSLTLPRAAVAADEALGLDLFSGHVDLAKSGLAQVTMGTNINHHKGAAVVSKTPPTTLGRPTSRLRRLSRSFTSSSSKGKEAETPAKLQSGFRTRF
ncbi:hypothetical protein M407DRAFT_20078 [Tulasnella calospora MUT 4182]|uniref:Uncharacterized protein n=1 Tax=Tulasnella calospora MUT 4182 TaxID=1051891 RepID=A0A0C3QSH8_9AGAM|nr:hypothetical protein M407DRAFT_20078 [Tulasnella calospora MUT 4182]